MITSRMQVPHSDDDTVVITPGRPAEDGPEASSHRNRRDGLVDLQDDDDNDHELEMVCPEQL